MDDKLEKYRKKIDVIDASLVRLIAKRMRVVERVAKYKKRNNIEAHQPGRWTQVLERVGTIAESTGVLDAKLVKDIWDRMHEESLKREREMGVS